MTFEKSGRNSVQKKKRNALDRVGRGGGKEGWGVNRRTEIFLHSGVVVKRKRYTRGFGRGRQSVSGG